MSVSKKIALSFAILLTLAIVAYSVFWFIVARQITNQIDVLWVSMGAGGATTTAEKPVAHGFPGAPTVIFKGEITEANGTIWNFPELIYRGFPVPGFMMGLFTPQGFSIQGPLFPRPITVDDGIILIGLPANLPTAMKVPELTAWQKDNGQIPIHQLYFKSGNLVINGQGYFSLDEQLQLAGHVQARIVGMGGLLDELEISGAMQGKSIGLARSFLTMMTQKDAETGEEYFIADLKIQKRGVFFGPLRIGYMPEIVWDAQ